MEDRQKTNTIEATSLRFDRYLVTHPADEDGSISSKEMEMIELSFLLALINEALTMDGFRLREHKELIGAGLKFIRRSCFPYLEQVSWTPEARKRDFLRRLNIGWTLLDLQAAEESPVLIWSRNVFLAYKRIVEETLNGREPYPVEIISDRHGE